MTLDLPFGLSDLDKVFSVTDLLSNQESLIQEFKPDVSKMLVKEGFFKGPYLREYNNHFKHLIQSLVRKQVIKHFPTFSPEEIVLLTDLDFIQMIAPDLFEKKNYYERNNNE